jgi:hypothetical protein
MMMATCLARILKTSGLTGVASVVIMTGACIGAPLVLNQTTTISKTNPKFTKSKTYVSQSTT